MDVDIHEQIERDRSRANELYNHHIGYDDYGDWFVMSSELKDYNSEFKNILYPLTGYRTIQNAIYDWGIPKEQLIGVNFMGETLPLDELGVGGFGCELIDNKRSEQLREKDKKTGRTVVEGDLDQESTWTKIQKQLGERKINVGLWRSVGGITTLPVLPHSIFRQINKAYPLMDQKHSLYLADLTAAASMHDSHATPLLVHFTRRLVDGLNSIDGIEATCMYEPVKLHGIEHPHHELSFGYTKQNGSPAKLPIEQLRRQDPLLDQWIEMSEKYEAR